MTIIEQKNDIEDTTARKKNDGQNSSNPFGNEMTTDQENDLMTIIEHKIEVDDSATMQIDKPNSSVDDNIDNKQNSKEKMLDQENNEFTDEIFEEKSDIIVDEIILIVKDDPLNKIDADDQIVTKKVDEYNSQDNISGKKKNSTKRKLGKENEFIDAIFEEKSDMIDDETNVKDDPLNISDAQAKDWKEKPYFCNKCNKRYKQKTHLSAHVSSIHEGKRPYKCSVCEATYTANTNLKLHIYTVHKKKKGKKDPALVEKKENQCHICNNNYDSNAALKRHIDFVHQRKNVVKCQICDTDFSENGSLKRHIRTVHEGKKSESQRCPKCSKMFSSKPHMKKHIESVHEGKKPYKCSQCSAAFYQSSGLDRHNSSFNACSIHEKKKLDSSRNNQCPHCDYKNSTNQKLNRHIDNNHSDQYTEKKHVCEKCEKSFIFKSSLIDHIKYLCKNSGNERECSICDKKFATNGALKRHIVSVHEEKKLFLCSMCDDSFLKKGLLKNHIASVHEEKKPSICSLNLGYK